MLFPRSCLTARPFSMRNFPQFPNYTIVVYTSAMHKLSFIMLVSVLVGITPFIGLQSGFQAGILSVLGICLFVTAYTLRKKQKHTEGGLSEKETTSEALFPDDDSVTTTDRT